MARSIFDSRSNHNSYYRSPSDHSANGIYYLLFIFILAIAILIFDNLKKKKDRMESKRRTTKKVLITGGCEGIGRELAIQFAKNLKCDIIIFDNRKEHVEDLRKKL